MHRLTLALAARLIRFSPPLLCPLCGSDRVDCRSEYGFRMIDESSRNLRTANANFLRKRALRRCWRPAACAAAAAATLGACSSLGGLTGDSVQPAAATTASAPAPSNASFASRVKAFFSGDSGNLNSPAPQAAAGAEAADIQCPSVEYRQGAATLEVNNPGAENTALSLRYQASFTQTARECILRGNNLTIKVGVQGRVVVGPAGASGSISIPLRYALVREGSEPKTLWTKLFMVPVTIADSQLNLPWLHIEEEMTVPRPSGNEIDDYVIYVGFDPEGVSSKPKPAANKATRPR